MLARVGGYYIAHITDQSHCLEHGTIDQYSGTISQHIVQ